MSTRTVTIAGQEQQLPPVTARKFVRIGKVLKNVARTTPEIIGELSRFTTEYEANNKIVLSRTQALMRFGPEPAYVPLLEEDGAVKIGLTGDPIMVPQLDEAGNQIVRPGRLDHMTDADWEASNQQLELPRSPGLMEQIAAVFPLAFEAAEDQLVQLYGILLVDNKRLADAIREGDGAAARLISEEGEEFLDRGDIGDMLELLVVAIEVSRGQIDRVIEDLGDRVGKALAMMGLGGLAPKIETRPSTKPTSSTDSPAATAGIPGPPSTESSSTSSADSQIE